MITIDPQVVNNIIGFMERAPLKGDEVPAYAVANNWLHSVLKEGQAIKAAQDKEKADAKEKNKGQKKTPKPKGNGAAGGKKTSSK